MPTKRSNTPWRHKVRHYVKKCVKTSKSVSCCQKVPWRQNVCHDINKCNIRHSAKTFVTSKICHVINKSWCYKVRHDVNTRHDDKRFVITQKSSSLLQKFVMTSKSCHDVKTFVYFYKLPESLFAPPHWSTKAVPPPLFFKQTSYLTPY